MLLVAKCLGAWGVDLWQSVLGPGGQVLLVLGFLMGWRMVSALHIIVDNYGVPTLIGYCGEWPQAF